MLEKKAAPIVREMVRGKLFTKQFAAREDSDCNVAKLHMHYNATQRGLKKGFLIDVRKAFDSVIWTRLEEKIRAKMCEQRTLLIAFLYLYRTLKIEIAGGEIAPQRGDPQGTVFGPVLFCIYIDDELREAARENEEVEIQAFMEDILLQTERMNELQKGASKLIIDLAAINMLLNPDKCELVTDDAEDYLIEPIENTVIGAKSMVKYLGQVVNSEGKSTTALTTRMYGKIGGSTRESGRAVISEKILAHL